MLKIHSMGKTNLIFINYLLIYLNRNQQKCFTSSSNKKVLLKMLDKIREKI